LSPEQRQVIEVDGRQLTVSNLDKVLYPEAGFSKADVIWYYLHVAPVLLPHLQGRPLTMARYPDGVDGKSFFEKNTARKAPAWAHCVRVPRADRSKGPEFIEQLVVDDLATLIWVANLAALELHVPQWRSVADGAYGPVDLIVYDLDPGAPATIVECCVVALWLRVELESRGLATLPKTSGLKGMQLYARLEPPWPWERAHATARDIAQLMEREHPGQALSNMRRDLRPGKVLIDWSQNHAAKTTIAPYSLRAFPQPTVSTPLTWEEVAEGAKGGGDRLRFLAGEVLERVKSVGDLFAPLTGPAAATSRPARRSRPKGLEAKAKAKT
jgi:bifunctional non-homologous end joining protein LigD